MSAIKNVDIKFTQLFINNNWVDSSSGKTFAAINPTTGGVITQVQEAGVEDVDKAVKAASDAFKIGSSWRNMDASQRGDMLLKLADLMKRDLDYLAGLETYNCGKLYQSSLDDINYAISALKFYAGAADKVCGQVIPSDGNVFSYTRCEPVGVCAAITPWNYPIELAVIKIAPALAMGNTVVLKPAEQTPLTTIYLGHLIKEAGFPQGVVNIIAGFGPTTGQPLVQHPLVRHISFTGSTVVGKIIQREAAEGIKRVSLELGGKSPLIVFSDADLDKAVKYAHEMCVVNQGQCCCAATRTFVHESIYDEFVKKTIVLASKAKIGDPMDQTVTHGPQIDEEQFNRIMELIKSGKAEGAKLEIGGERVGDKGFFVQPTVFSNVTDDMRIAKEEIFGPVQQILRFKDIDEVIERANTTDYGLAAGLFTNDLNTALKVSSYLEAGQVFVNQYMTSGVQLPFGGFKQSGLNREFGMDGLKQFYEVKAVIVDLPFKV